MSGFTDRPSRHLLRDSRFNRRQLLALLVGGLALLGLPGRGSASVTSAAPRPAIIGRPQWGANEAYRFEGGGEVWPEQYQHYVKAFVHHTVTSDGGVDPAAIVRSIYYYHAISLGWGDIGYNYLIDKGGRIYQGRYGGEGVVGGHALRYNPGSAGIALIGDFGTEGPTDAMLASLTALVAWLCTRWGIDPRGSGYFIDKGLPNIAGHRDAIDTSCPGNAVYSRLGGLRQASYDRLPDYGQAVVSHNTPLVLGASSQTAVSVTLRNGGKRPWTPSQFKLGYRWRDNLGNVVASEDLRTAMPRDVPLGDQVALETRLATPARDGSFSLEWDVVHSGVTWISEQGAPGLRVDVTVGRAAADRAAFMGNNMPVQLPPATLTTASITLRNAGTLVWGNLGRNAYRLGYRWFDSAGNQVVQGADDDLRTSLPSPMNPGDTVTLLAQVRAPAVAGDYRIRWDIVREGFYWLADRGSTPLTVSVRMGGQPYAVQWLVSAQPVFMRPGETRTVRFRVRNVGTNQWVSGGRNGYRLGYRWYGGGGNQVVQSASDDLRTALPAPVDPGSEVELQAQIKAPTAEGTYTLRWDMVHEGVGWFADRGSPASSSSVVITTAAISERRFPTVWRAGQGGW